MSKSHDVISIHDNICTIWYYLVRAREAESTSIQHWTNAFPVDTDVPVEAITSSSSLLPGEQQVSFIASGKNQPGSPKQCIMVAPACLTVLA